MTIRMRITLALLALAAILAVSGQWRLSDPEAYYQPDGKWMPINVDVWQATIGPDNPGTLTLNFFISIAAVYCLAWEAEHGEASISLVARYRDVNTPAGYWVDVLPEPFCVKDVEVQVTVSSKTRQTVQVARLPTVWDTSNQNVGYLSDLCQRTFQRRKCDDAILSASRQATREDIVRRGTISLIAGGLFALAALVNHIGLFTVLTAAFPSRQARQVRDELRRAARGATVFEASQTEAYRRPATSAFRRKQDIQDLKDLIADAQSEVGRLSEAERRAANDAAAEKKLAADLEAAIKRVKELKAKLDEDK